MVEPPTTTPSAALQALLPKDAENAAIRAS
jgi:hypothetical protein